MKLNEMLSPELYAQVKARIDEVNAGQTDKTKCVRFADLSEGGYVSVDKHNSQVNALTQQVTDLQGQITQRDTDITGLQGKLTAAQADATKLTDVQTELTSLQTKYDADKQSWAANVTKQRKEFMVREKANGAQFSSAAAKRDFIRQANDKDFQIDGDTLLGYEDFLTKYKADNPGAFVDAGKEKPEDGEKAPQIVLPKNQKQDPEKSVFGFHFNGVRPKPNNN
jgi:light-regulated signal transduction histidine kinase (bacteriophytochrome)